MPHHSYPTRPRTRLAPVPAAVLVPPPHTPTGRRPVGLSAHAAEAIIRGYTTPGEPVADLDRDPHVVAAVERLRRRLQPADTDPATDAPRLSALGRARLVIAHLPRPGVAGPARVTTWMRHVDQRMLADGGHLVVVLATGAAGRRLAGHTGVVASAQAAGLAYQQQLIDIWAPMDEHEPAADPDPAAGAVVRLVGGRHRPAHREIYVFTTRGRP